MTVAKQALLRNALRTPDGTLIESKHRHDYVTYKDKNGETYMVDGGLDYLRRNINKEPATELNLTLEDSHVILRDKVTWGTYGINGDQPLRQISVKDMETDHLQSVVKIPGVYPQILQVMKDELKFRGEN